LLFADIKLSIFVKAAFLLPLLIRALTSPGIIELEHRQ